MQHPQRIDSTRLTAPSASSSPTSPYFAPTSPTLSEADNDNDTYQSPSASAFLRTEQTLEELSRQLSQLGGSGDNAHAEDGDEDGCGCGEACGLSSKLSLSGQIGAALLQRCEALEKKYDHEVKRLQHRIDVKRSALDDSVRRMHALEEANTTHLSQYTDLNRKHEALEKRYTQSLHAHTLTQQSLTHVRNELATQRKQMNRQSISLSLAGGAAGADERVAEAERRAEEARDAQVAAERTQRDTERRCKRAEARVVELEARVLGLQQEVEAVKEARRGDAAALLENAKERLEALHKDLSETLRAESPEDEPEYQRALEGLVASNAMLKHDASELSHLLAESRDEVRHLRDEVEDLRAHSAGGRISPSVPVHLASELAAQLSGPGPSRPHSRTESTPGVGTFTAGERSHWARMSVSSNQSYGRSRFAVAQVHEHARKSSLAPSFASTSTTDGALSPGLGFGSIGEYGGQLMRDAAASAGPVALSPTTLDGRESPSFGFRTSPSGGIGYVLNGVPKVKRPGPTRSISDRPRRASGQFSSRGVDTITEQPMSDGHTTDEPLSPASDTFRQADISRKRRSLMLARHTSASPHESADYSANGSTLVDVPSDLASPISDGPTPVHKTSPAKKYHRRTLLLLTQNRGVQTDPEPADGDRTVRLVSQAHMDAAPSVTATSASPNPEDKSETSSIHHHAQSGQLAGLVDHMVKLLTRLRAADVPALNKRLKKQHINGGDVSHLSRSTLRALSADITDLRHHFRPLLDASAVQRKEWAALLKMLRDVFNELVDMQALINDVTLEPKLAKRLHKEAYRDEEEETPAPSAGGLGWIANPITRLFVTPAVATEEEPRPAMRADRNRLKPEMAARAGSKQAAVASATTTHVEVEFGGAGIVRRAAPAQQAQTQTQTQTSVDGGPASRTVSVGTGGGMASQAGGGAMLEPPHRTLRPSKSRANRNELLGIFAGAPRGTGVEPLPGSGSRDAAILAGPGPGPGAGLRSISAQSVMQRGGAIGGDRTIRARPSKLSPGVDAVLDLAKGSAAPGVADSAIEEEDADAEPSFQPLLYRTLRPRGMSDSSIRSTFVSAAADGRGDSVGLGVGGAANTSTAAASSRQGGYAGLGGGLLAGLGRRLYWAPSTTASAQSQSASALASSGVSGSKVTSSSATSGGTPAGLAIPAPPGASSAGDTSAPLSASAPRPIASPRKSKSSGTGSVLAASNASASATGSAPGGPGFMSFIAQSLQGDGRGGRGLLSEVDADGEADADAALSLSLGGKGRDGETLGRSPGRMGRVEEEELLRASMGQGISSVPGRTYRGGAWD